MLLPIHRYWFIPTVKSETLNGKLFDHGLCVPYKRVLEITKDMTENNLQQFELNKVCIPKLSFKNLVTFIAKDNINLNASSTISKNHYHGTNLSMLSFTFKNVPGEINTPNHELQKECYDIQNTKRANTKRTLLFS